MCLFHEMSMKFQKSLQKTVTRKLSGLKQPLGSTLTETRIICHVDAALS